MTDPSYPAEGTPNVGPASPESASAPEYPRHPDVAHPETSPSAEVGRAETAAAPAAAAVPVAPSAPASAPAPAPAPPAPSGWVAPGAPPAPAVTAAVAPAVPTVPYGQLAQYHGLGSGAPAAAPITPTTPIEPGGSSFGYGPPPGYGAAAAPAAPTPKRRGMSVGAALGVGALVGALVGGASGAGVVAIANHTNSSVVQATEASTPGTITINDADDVNLISAVANNAMPSVVTIAVTGAENAGSGSGVVIDDQGHIVTNSHVITGGGTISNPAVSVTTSDGRVLPASVVGYDPIMDIGVLKVDESAALPAVEVGDSAALNVGDFTIAIGAPLGLSGTVTTGIISALNRSITVASSEVPQEFGDQTDDESDDGTEPQTPEDFFNFDLPNQSAPTTATSTVALPVIQTDAAINPGNSGGALLDSEGRLIGINVAIANTGSSSSGTNGSIGVGFAVPANVAMRVVTELIADGAATHGLLGATITDAAADPVNAASGQLGASVLELTAGGAAEAAGIQVGDLITSVDGYPVTGRTDLTATVRSFPADTTVEVTFLRDGESLTTTATLGTLAL